MSDPVAPGLEPLVERINAAVRLGDVSRVTAGLKTSLTDLIRRTAFRLPDRLTRVCPDSYARRLVHRDRGLGYTVVAMIWGPGQHTELHDHAGMWCVECVLAGEIDVVQYDLVEQHADRCQFVQQSRVRAGIGTAGCLIPPHEYHVLHNSLSDQASITLHVYGGEMDHCNLYLPEAGGWWKKMSKHMEYSDD